MKTLTGIFLVILTTNLFAIDIECSDYYNYYTSSKTTKVLAFHNGGGTWTGYMKPYITFHFDQYKQFIKMSYKNNVQVNEVSSSHYEARIKVEKGFNKKFIIVNCTLLI